MKADSIDVETLAHAVAHELRQPLGKLLSALDMLELRISDHSAAPELLAARNVVDRLAATPLAQALSGPSDDAVASLLQLEQMGASVALHVDKISSLLAGSDVHSSTLSLLRAATDHLAHSFAVFRCRLLPGAERDVDRVRTIAVRSFLGSVAAMFQPDAREKGLILELACPPELTVQSRVHLLSTVLMNLASNAVKYTDAGGVTLFGRPCAGGEVTLGVADTGIGIDAATLAHITERGVRGHSADVQKRQGDGLGLANAADAASQLGAKLCFESEVGRGTLAQCVLRGVAGTEARG